MFTYLKVQNFALIDDVEIEFKKGFTAFVGETGAGKSLLVDAINLLSGARGAATFVKSGAEAARIQGSFFLKSGHPILNVVKEQDIEVHPEEEMLVERQLIADGRTICKIQGMKVPAAFLKKVMRQLIDIHAQHENSALLDPRNHLPLLDGFIEDQAVLLEYQESYQAVQKLKVEKTRLQALHEEFAALPLYQKQEEELINANVTTEEITAIHERLGTLKTFNQQFDALVVLRQYFEDSQLLEQLYQMKNLAETVSIAPYAHERMNNAYYDLQDIRDDIAQRVASFAEQKKEQEQLERRIAVIFDLQKKYGDDLPFALQQLQDKIKQLHNIEFDYVQFEKRLNEQQRELIKKGQALRDVRKKSARQLEGAIMQQLRELHMEKVEFKVSFTEQEPTINGLDSVAFYLKTNVGTDFRRLSDIASGGELSRMMLALKIIFAEKQTLSTIIFDEIDTGISGAVAEAIAKKMRAFSATQQVFVITHLPQVLAASNYQLLIEKRVCAEQTQIAVRYLNSHEHQIEVAKMLSGTAITDIGKRHAADLTAAFEEQ